MKYILFTSTKVLKNIIRNLKYSINTSKIIHNLMPNKQKKYEQHISE